MGEANRGRRSTVAQPGPGGRATGLFCLTPQVIGKLTYRRVGSAPSRRAQWGWPDRAHRSGQPHETACLEAGSVLLRLGDLLNRGDRLLRSRVGHDGGVHAADLPLDEVQVGTGPGALVLGNSQLQADAVPTFEREASRQRGCGTGRPPAGPAPIQPDAARRWISRTSRP